jgi:hypothetical protein
MQTNQISRFEATARQAKARKMADVLTMHHAVAQRSQV